MTRHECNKIVDRISHLSYKDKFDIIDVNDNYTASAFVRKQSFGNYSIRIDVYKNGVIMKGSRFVETVEQAEDAFYNILKDNLVL